MDFEKITLMIDEQIKKNEIEKAFLMEMRNCFEKQIPEKVNNKRCFNLDGLPEAYLGYMGECPRCNEQNANSKYCTNCGQRLDWSGEK